MIDISELTTPEILAELARRGTTFAGLGRLIQWNTSSKAMTAKFSIDKMDEDGELRLFSNPFDGVKEGAKDGQLFYLTAVMAPEPQEIAKPKPVISEVPKSKREKKSWDEMPYVAQAGTLCSDRDFQDYLKRQCSVAWGNAITAADGVLATAAGIIVREKCKVSSRSDILLGTPASEAFRQLVREFRDSQATERFEEMLEAGPR